MSDLDKFREFFAQFGIKLEKGYNDSYTLEGEKVFKHYADAWLKFEGGKFIGIDIEY